MDDHAQHAHHGHHDHHGAHGADPAPTSDALKDPVCGMEVTSQSPYRATYRGANYFFCSPKCQGKFDAEPARYAGQPQGTVPASEEMPAPAGTIYTCPMHPEIRQDHPGICPKCGMTLEPVLPGLDEEENPELRDFRHRFWWTLLLTIT